MPLWFAGRENLPPRPCPPTRESPSRNWEKTAGADAGPTALAAAGVGYLVSGDVDRAITTLDEAATVGETRRDLVRSQCGLSGQSVMDTRAARRISGKSARSRKPFAERRWNQRSTLQSRVGHRSGPDDLGLGAADAWKDYERVNGMLDGLVWRASVELHRWMTRRRAGKLVPRSFALDSSRFDGPFVNETVKLFPEASLEYFEQEVLTAWAWLCSIASVLPQQHS